MVQMAMLDNSNGARNVLPSINHVALDKIEVDRLDRNRLPFIPTLNISTGKTNLMVSSTVGSAPYPTSSATSTAMSERPGYTSPLESTTRRTIREERESPFAIKSLPSIHEALGDRSILNPTHSVTGEPRTSGSTPVTATTTTFPEFTTGPANPFTQHIFKPPTTPHTNSLPDPNPTSPMKAELPALTTSRTSAPVRDLTATQSQLYTHPISPRTSLPTARTEPPALPSGSISSNLPRTYSTYPPDTSTGNRSLPLYGTQAAQPPVTSSSTSHPSTSKVMDDGRSALPGAGQVPPYGDTVKRHLDVYDAEVAFHEVDDATSRILDFTKYWNQRLHQVNRAHTAAESIPPLQDVDETIRQCQRAMENLHRVRELAMVQQTTLSEERARKARTQPDEQYRSILEEYKGGGFAAGDAKKRRGKAAPPGRCHSCNRAETPEWRRGPDGARTLCNACGLHYAKLTRKMSANKSGHMAASSLRPKGLDGIP